MPDVRTFIFLALSAMLAACIPQLAPGQTVSIRGLVTDAANGATLTGANVIVTTLDGERLGATATDVEGYYRIGQLPPGRHQVRISYVGYQSRRDTLSLDPGQRTPNVRTYNVKLSPTEQTLEEVRVEAERGPTERQAGTETVGAAELDRIPTPGPSGDLANYLQTLPSVVSIGDRGGQLFIRGGTSSQNMVLVDGMRLMKPFHISGFFSAFPQEIVKSADVHAGGFSAEHMGAISSVIDVSLRNGNFNDFEASVATSSFLTTAQVEGPIREGTDSFLAVGRYSVIEETAEPLFRYDAPLNFYDLTTRYSVRTENVSCNLTGMQTSDRGRISSDRNLVLSWSNTAVGGKCLFFGKNLNNAIKLSTGFSNFQNEAGTADAPQRTASVQKIHLALSSRQDFLGSTLKYGGRWIVTSYEHNLDEKFSDLQSSNPSEGTLRAYASISWDFGEHLTLTPSFGTQVTNLTSPTYEPRLRMAFRPDGTERSEVSLALGKYNQVASGFSDELDAGTTFTVWKPPNKDEPLAEALHGILGYRHQINSWMNVSVEGYAKDLKNIQVPVWSPVARFDVQTTFGEGTTYGADLRTEIDAPPLYLSLGYGWSKVTYEAPGDKIRAVSDDKVKFTPAHDRRHQLNLAARYNFSGFTVNANWRLASGRPFTKVLGFDLSLDLPQERPTNDSGVPLTYFERPFDGRLPFFNRFDLSLERSFKVSSNVSIDAKIGTINTFDRRNVFHFNVDSFTRVNQTPILPYLSIKFNLK